MNSFVMITPEKAIEVGDKRSLKELRSLAATDVACVCGSPVWRFGGSFLCFECTTGESDRSHDYELETT
jgi:hypothetical protein